ncbi:MAG: hypothetical protein J2O48_03930 [Solirubrobacterales bacterium]|nr:hypothetical protein [Solirubrobacterales bacterium]
MLTLAARIPITEISVSAICRQAGLTRDTFYRHADSPVDLLADALAAEIDPLIQQLPETEGAEDAARAVLRHVHQRAAIYRGAMQPSLAAPVQSNLELSLRRGTELWAQLHPEILPPAFASDEAAKRIAIAFAAAGAVGAIEEWLRQSDEDIDRAVELILAAAPEWWRARPVTD